MKPGKHQRSKQRSQDLCWKVHDRAKSFVLLSTLCMNYVINTFLLVSSLVRSKQLLCFVHGQGQKREQKHTTENFDEFHSHSPLLTVGFETMVFIIVRLFSRLFINFADYVNVYYFHVFTFSIA